MESWEVRGAFPQAEADPNYRQTMIQPPRSDGFYEAPGHICAIKKAIQGANDAGQLLARHRNTNFHSWGWTTVPCEPETFVINHGKEWARLIANTDDFAVSASSQSYLNIIRVPFEKEWKITIQRFIAENPIMQHAGIKIQQFPDGSISMTNPKAIHSMLQTQGLQDCNPAPAPHIDGHDMSDMQADEDMTNFKTYQSILGSCWFLADTTHPEIVYITGIAGQHGPRHGMCKKSREFYDIWPAPPTVVCTTQAVKRRYLPHFPTATGSHAYKPKNLKLASF
jgi:hypothetical protein